jgi:hypothetical protein
MSVLTKNEQVHIVLRQGTLFYQFCHEKIGFEKQSRTSTLCYGVQYSHLLLLAYCKNYEQLYILKLQNDEDRFLNNNYLRATYSKFVKIRGLVSLKSLTWIFGSTEVRK